MRILFLILALLIALPSASQARRVTDFLLDNLAASDTDTTGSVNLSGYDVPITVVVAFTSTASNLTLFVDLSINGTTWEPFLSESIIATSAYLIDVFNLQGSDFGTPSALKPAHFPYVRFRAQNLSATTAITDFRLFVFAN